MRAIWTAGYTAYHCGGTNPYEEDSELWFAWWDGYADAEREAGTYDY